MGRRVCQWRGVLKSRPETAERGGFGWRAQLGRGLQWTVRSHLATSVPDGGARSRPGGARVCPARLGDSPALRGLRGPQPPSWSSRALAGQRRQHPPPTRGLGRLPHSQPTRVPRRPGSRHRDPQRGPHSGFAPTKGRLMQNLALALVNNPGLWGWGGKWGPHCWVCDQFRPVLCVGEHGWLGLPALQISDGQQRPPLFLGG